MIQKITSIICLATVPTEAHVRAEVGTLSMDEPSHPARRSRFFKTSDDVENLVQHRSNILSDGSDDDDTEPRRSATPEQSDLSSPTKMDEESVDLDDEDHEELDDEQVEPNVHPKHTNDEPQIRRNHRRSRRSQDPDESLVQERNTAADINHDEPEVVDQHQAGSTPAPMTGESSMPAPASGASGQQPGGSASAQQAGMSGQQPGASVQPQSGAASAGASNMPSPTPSMLLIGTGNVNSKKRNGRKLPISPYPSTSGDQRISTVQRETSGAVEESSGASDLKPNGSGGLASKMHSTEQVGSSTTSDSQHATPDKEVFMTGSSGADAKQIPGMRTATKAAVKGGKRVVKSVKKKSAQHKATKAAQGSEQSKHSK